MGIKQITAVSSACDALRFLQHNSADLIITDWNMPGINGLELLHKLRSKPEYTDVPIIMVTCNGEQEQITQAIMAGATRYVIKPVSPAVLEMNVAYCQMWRSERQFRKMQ